MRRRDLILAGAGALAVAGGRTPASAQPAQQRGSLARIMVADMLQVELAYLESILGPARRVFPRIGQRGQDRMYRVDGCEVSALTAGTQVQAYRLRLTPACSFDMQRMVPNFRPAIRAHQLTFGMLAESFGVTFLPSCFIACGNAADPVCSVHGESSRADGFIEVIGSATYNNEQVAAAVDRFLTAARRLASEDDIISGRFNCHPRYGQLGLQAFRDVRLQEITLGFDLPEAPRRC